MERKFASDLEQNESIKLYAKLPPWFKIPTPLGGYNPDWAIVVATDKEEKLYFVAETKGDTENLRIIEEAKTKCGKVHFEELSNHHAPVEYKVVKNIDELIKCW